MSAGNDEAAQAQEIVEAWTSMGQRRFGVARASDEVRRRRARFALALHRNGKTYQQIADLLCCSKSNIGILVAREEAMEAWVARQPDDRRQSVRMSVRTANCLKNIGVPTLAELAKKRKCELLATENFGQACLREVEELLLAHGLTLAPDNDGPKVKSKKEMRAEKEMLRRGIVEANARQEAVRHKAATADRRKVWRTMERVAAATGAKLPPHS